MKGIILAGGLGTRLRPISHTGPKQLVPIANKPVLHYIIEDIKNAGITEIGIIVGYTKDRIQKIIDSCGDGSKWNVKITYIEQDAPRGLAHAVSITKDFIKDDNFVVYLGDNILKEGINNFVEKFKKSNAEASILLCNVDNPQKYGVAVLEGNEVINVEEKPENPKSNLAIVGVYLFKKNIFDIIKQVNPGKGGELQLTDAIEIMINSNDHKVEAHIVTGWWDDTGTTGAVLRANHLVLADLEEKRYGEIEEGVSITGKVSIGKNSIIKEGSVIKGPIIIGNNCKIGPNSYVGPYTSIGDNTEITNGEIESSIIVGDCKINFNQKIVNSLIGRHSKLIYENKLPKGHKLVLGENSEVIL
jgi:glucose-1-phosphate thymidylyltransferase